jgi:hypothetical protein
MDAAVFLGAYFCVRMGLSASHLQSMVETLHLSYILSLVHIDFSADSKVMQGAGHLMVSFVLYKLVRLAGDSLQQLRSRAMLVRVPSMTR